MNTDKAADGAAPVAQIDPNGAMAKAGVKPGYVIAYRALYLPEDNGAFRRIKGLSALIQPE